MSVIKHKGTDRAIREIDVKLVRWPADERKREQFRNLGIPVLLVVEAGCQPPICADAREDWIRAPVSRGDLEARIATLRAKAWAGRLPEIDPVGVIRYNGRSCSVSPTEADLLHCLVRDFGEVVARSTLLDCLPERPARCQRNALDLHIMRIRRRIGIMGLVIRTVWGQGYLLEVAK
ncbi:winged helix-turn-helix domain-containing protein [Micromonospora sp. NPDC007271]|uniref:winged helix-turn-helix domain-containing protein n=1 Tax=Micromonospora sp. NPDC007271 TaxID=3154587 RepID=UPI0033ED5817